MSIEITARYKSSAEDVQEYARERAEAIADEFSKVEHVHVILEQEKHLSVAEVIVQAGNHIRVEAKESGENMRVSIDAATAKVEKQLRKRWEKIQDHRAARKHSEAERIGGIEE